MIQTSAAPAVVSSNQAHGQRSQRQAGRPSRGRQAVPVIALGARLDSEAVSRLVGPTGPGGPEHLCRLNEALAQLKAAPADSVIDGEPLVERLAMRYVGGTQTAPHSARAIVYGLNQSLQPLASESRLTIALNPRSIDQGLGHAEALSRVLHSLALESIAYFAGRILLEVHANPDAAITFLVRGMCDRRLGSSGASQHTAGAAALIERSWESSGCGLAIHTCQRVVRALGSDLMHLVLPTGERRFWFGVTASPGS